MWFKGAINQALDKSKNESIMLFTFVKGENEDSIKMSNILNEGGFKDGLIDQLIALELDETSENGKNFNQIYPFNSVPMIYLISSQASVLGTISGYMDKQNLIININAALTKQKQLRNESSSQQLDTNDQKQASGEPSLSLKRNNESSPIKDENEFKDKEKRAQEMLKEIRVKKCKEEEKRALDMEKERIRTGKELQTAKEIQRQKEMEEIVKQREREKQEEKKHRERVLAQIKQDQEDRKARNASLVQSETKKPLVISQPTKISSNQTRIQLRLPDSSTLKNVFGISDTLRTVIRYIENNSSYQTFKLCTNIPVKEFGDDDLDKTLVDLKLIPSASLIVKKLPIQQ